jgi:hypothetical protein
MPCFKLAQNKLARRGRAQKEARRTMDHLNHKIKGPLKIFVDMFGEYMSDDDIMQFYSNRTKGEKHTFLNSDFRQADKMSVVILEEYEVRGKLAGNVLMTFPEPEYGIPVFNFQLGGNGVKSIGLLDLSPTTPNIDYSPLIPIHEKYKKLLGVDPPHVDWVDSISSPYLLHCHYEELDTDLFLEAMSAYLKVWIEHYYKPAEKLTDELQIEIVTNAIYKFKRVLHANDPAYAIFSKEWGPSVADAFYYLETRNYPALAMPEHDHAKFKAWENKELRVLWEREAQEQVLQAPESYQQTIRDAVEQRVSAAHLGIITADVFEKYKEAKPG